MSESQQPPTTPHTPAGNKKGLSPIAWIAIGCVGLLLLGALLSFACTAMVAKKAKDFVEEAGDNPGMAAAEMMIRLNPDLELISKDEEAQTLTVHDKSTDKTMTVSLAQIMEGKIGVESEEGSFDLDASGGIDGSITGTRVDAEGETTDFSIGGAAAGGRAGNLPSWLPSYKGSALSSPFVANTGDEVSGAATFATSDSVDEVAGTLQRDLERNGFSVETSSFQTGDTNMIMLTCKGPDEHDLTISVSARDGQTHASMSFSGRP